jgi:DNA polymerase III delta subunit
MNSLIYGDDVIKITQKVRELEKNDYKYFYGDLSSLRNLLQSTPLFKSSDSENYILNLDSNENISINDSLLELLENNTTDANFVFVSTNKIRQTNKIKKAFGNITNYKLVDNKEVFKFLDSLFLKNEKQALSYCEKFIKESHSTYIISMVFYNTKNLLLFYFDKKNFSKLHPFVQQKTANVAKIYTKQKTLNILHALSAADYKTKTGSSEPESVVYSLIYYILLI